MNLTRKRWRTLIACCFINLCLGSIYVWSVFAASMAEFLSTGNGVALTTADLAIVYTIANSVGPITMITGGSFNDKFGPKKVILTGGLMVGIGMIASGFATSVGALIRDIRTDLRTWTWNDLRYSGQHMYEIFPG